MTRGSLPVLLIAAAATAQAAPVPEDARDPVPYFATRVGARWTYQFPDAEVTLVATRVERKGRARVVTVGRVGDDGKATPFSKVEVSDRGLSLWGADRFVLRATRLGWVPDGKDWSGRGPPVCVLQAPERPGRAWDGELSAMFPVRFAVDVEKEVVVPAGRFAAVPVDMAVGFGRRPTALRYWYARGVGLVRWTTPAGGVVELKAFSPGRD